MSLVNEQIKEQLGDFAGRVGPKVILPATVMTVNDDDTIAVEFSDGSTVDDARLKSIVKQGNKMILIPVIGSIVSVGRIENSDEFIVVAVSEVSEIVYEVDSLKYSANALGFLIQKGDDTLRDALVQIIEAMEPVIVFEGRNPDYIKLASAKLKIQNILR